MNNIEKLAREHGSTCYTGQEYHFERWQLEAFAKALQQSSEPVAEVCYMTIDGDSKLGGIKWLQNKYTSPISTKLFTHPPASVPKAEYDKLLDLLERAQNGLKWYQDAHPEHASEADGELHAEIDAIAEAEGK